MQKLLRHFFPYSADSDGVTVRVSPSFLPEQSRARMGRWLWSYHIRIENHRDSDVQLLSRQWKITDGNGEVTHIEGDGIVGQQPVLYPGGSHDYVSGCPLATAFGAMEGHYVMVGAEGRFIAEIPRFPLTSEDEAL